MNKKQKDTLNEIKKRAGYTALLPKDFEFIWALIDYLENEIITKNNAILELHKRCKSYSDIIQQQDKAIAGFENRLKKFYGGDNDG